MVTSCEGLTACGFSGITSRSCAGSGLGTGSGGDWNGGRAGADLVSGIETETVGSGDVGLSLIVGVGGGIGLVTASLDGARNTPFIPSGVLGVFIISSRSRSAAPPIRGLKAL